MKYFIFVLLVLGFAFANNDTCSNCHKTLNSLNIKEHAVLKTCKECHIKSTSRHDEYRQDCFLCHDRNTLVKTQQHQHQQLSSCIKCHKPTESLLEITDRTPNLLDILNQK